MDDNKTQSPGSHLELRQEGPQALDEAQAREVEQVRELLPHLCQLSGAIVS
jgi:hypothetical protein